MIDPIREISAQAELVSRDTSYPEETRALMVALLSVSNLHTPRLQHEMKDGLHEYTCMGCNTPITTTTYPCETLRNIVASYQKVTF